MRYLTLQVVSILLLAIFAGLTMFPAAVSAESRYDRFNGLIHPGARKAQGMINRIGSSEKGRPADLLIIDDLEYHLSPDALLYTRSGAKTGIESYRPGMGVGFYAVKGVVTNMWPEDLEDIPPDHRSSGAAQAGSLEKDKETGIYLEDGVWKN